MNIFSYESKFSQVLLKISISCWLNTLWMVCSLPIFTIGASTTALYKVTLKVADETDSTISKEFFKAFRDNFAQATRIWLIMLVAGILLGTDGYIVSHLRAASTGPMAVLWTLNLALIICASIVYVIVLIYVFPLISRFENTDWAMIKNSFLIGIHFLFCTISVAAIHFAMFYAVVAIFTPLFIFGEGLCALLSSYLMLNVLRIVSGDPDEVGK